MRDPENSEARYQWERNVPGLCTRGDGSNRIMHCVAENMTEDHAECFARALEARAPMFGC